MISYPDADHGPSQSQPPLKPVARPERPCYACARPCVRLASRACALEWHCIAAIAARVFGTLCSWRAGRRRQSLHYALAGARTAVDRNLARLPVDSRIWAR